MCLFGAATFGSCIKKRHGTPQEMALLPRFLAQEVKCLPKLLLLQQPFELLQDHLTSLARQIRRTACYVSFIFAHQIVLLLLQVFYVITFVIPIHSQGAKVVFFIKQTCASVCLSNKSRTTCCNNYLALLWVWESPFPPRTNIFALFLIQTRLSLETLSSQVPHHIQHRVDHTLFETSKKGFKVDNSIGFGGSYSSEIYCV